MSNPRAAQNSSKASKNLRPLGEAGLRVPSMREHRLGAPPEISVHTAARRVDHAYRHDLSLSYVIVIWVTAWCYHERRLSRGPGLRSHCRTGYRHPDTDYRYQDSWDNPRTFGVSHFLWLVRCPSRRLEFLMSGVWIFYPPSPGRLVLPYVLPWLVRLSCAATIPTFSSLSTSVHRRVIIVIATVI